MSDKRRCIRSMRVARELMAAGFPAVDTEPSRQLPGHIVWIFDNSEEFAAALVEIMSAKRTTRQRD